METEYEYGQLCAENMEQELPAERPTAVSIIAGVIRQGTSGFKAYRLGDQFER
ncbi:hypothetical protein D3C80_2103460 [compost metagenome]